MEKVPVGYFAGVETGGTNTKCMIASNPSHILSEVVIPTSDPVITLEGVKKFFQEGVIKYKISLKSMGVAGFGPLDLDPQSRNYGSVISTPKIPWQNFQLLKNLKSSFNLPIAIDTDVNAAAFAEAQWGAGIGYSDFIYVTIGTGIGGGVISNGEIVHGLIHPEVGHMMIKHDLEKDPFFGNCPFHRDCLEGLASGSAMTARWGISPNNLPSDHPAWELEADYLAQMVLNLTLISSPKRIILGGGVAHHQELLPRVRFHFQKRLNAYLISPAFSENIDSYIVTPMLGFNSGIFGAIALARAIQ
jgi:fructokinase